MIAPKSAVNPYGKGCSRNLAVWYRQAA